jgi:small GTP-binding protein
MRHMFRYILLGDSDVGKSSLLLRLTDDRFLSCHDGGIGYQTIGVEYGSKVLSVCNQQVKVQVWDTAGHVRFRSIVHTFLRDVSVVLIVYDLTNRASFDAVYNYWLPYVRRTVTEYDNPRIVIVGNKSDETRLRQVSTSEGVARATSMGCSWYEVSACTGRGVDALFVDTVQCLLFDGTNSDGVRPRVGYRSDDENDRDCCCLIN